MQSGTSGPFGRQLLAVLAAATFVVSLAHGAFAPLAPFYASTLGGVAEPANVSRHVGWLAAVYALAVFLFAPLWGRLSDAHGRKPVLVAGFVVFLLGTLLGALSADPLWAYAARFAGGAGAAAIVPASQALLADISTAAQRSRRFVVLGSAVFAGVLLGPPFGEWTARVAMPMPLEAMPSMVNRPALAIVGLGVPLLLLLMATGMTAPSETVVGNAQSSAVRRRFVTASLMLSLLASFGVGSFEVGFSLFARQRLLLADGTVAAMFITCGVAMLAAQLLLLVDGVRHRVNALWIAAAFLLSSSALALAGEVLERTTLGLLVLVVAGAAGLVGPVLSYELVERDRSASGSELARLAAAGNLGQGLGAGAAGMLFAWHPLGPFAIASSALAAGAVVSLRYWGRARDAEVELAGDAAGPR